MDNGLVQETGEFVEGVTNVLILIVVDNGLVPMVVLVFVLQLTSVLILIVVDNGLVLRLVENNAPALWKS